MAQNQTSNGNSKARAEADAIGNQINTIKTDIAALTELVSEIAADRKNQMQAHVSETLHAAKDQVAHARSTAIGQANDAYIAAEDAVRRQPGLALGIAAGLGFLVGLIATSRRN